jgi:hypothetical protein
MDPKSNLSKKTVGLPLNNVFYSDNRLIVRAGRFTFPVHRNCRRATDNFAECTCGADDEVKRAHKQ